MAKLNQNKIDKLFEQIDDSIEKIQEKQAEIKSIIENYIYEIDSDEEDTDSDDSYFEDEDDTEEDSEDSEDKDDKNDNDERMSEITKNTWIKGIKRIITL